MKMTLLEIVQNILSDMNSDEVQSINDTVESQQVASIVRDTYYEIVASRIWPTTKQLYTIASIGNTTPGYSPLFVLPDGIAKVEKVWYSNNE